MHLFFFKGKYSVIYLFTLFYIVNLNIFAQEKHDGKVLLNHNVKSDSIKKRIICKRLHISLSVIYKWSQRLRMCNVSLLLKLWFKSFLTKNLFMRPYYLLLTV
jgi:hypothetical protein